MIQIMYSEHVQNEAPYPVSGLQLFTNGSQIHVFHFYIGQTHY